MARRPISYGEAVIADIAVGAVAGLVAAGMMHAFQSAWAAAIDKPESTPATHRAADAISEAVYGGPVSPSRKSLAGNAIHYTTGALIGAAYGLLAGVAPIITVGHGTLFGAAVFALGDELAVPALGFGPRASEAPAELHAYSGASHAVFALAMDFARRKLNERISAD